MSNMEIPGSNFATSSSSSTTPARPRKRLARPETWKRVDAKAKRARGQAYKSAVSGEDVAAVQQGPPCTCQRKCFGKFTEEELGKIFTGFWELGDKNVQDAYLHGLIRVRKVARRRPRVDSGTSTVTPRSASYVYVVSISKMELYLIIIGGRQSRLIVRGENYRVCACAENSYNPL